MAANLLIDQREWTVLRRFVKPHRSTRGADRWVGFPFRFTECDLGHDGSLRASVGKRSPEYSTRSPFLAAMGSTCEQGKPNGNQKTGGTALGRRRSKKRRLTQGALEAYLIIKKGKGQPILLIIRKGVASTGVWHPVGVRDESPFAVGLPEMVPTVHEANNR